MKREILKILKENSGRYVEYNQITSNLNISKSEIRFLLSELRKEGNLIVSEKGKGFKLVELVDDEELKQNLKEVLEFSQARIRQSKKVLKVYNDWINAIFEYAWNDDSFTDYICEYLSSGGQNISVSDYWEIITKQEKLEWVEEFYESKNNNQRV